MDAITVFFGLCMISALICALLGRFFPACMLRKVIQWVLYGSSILFLLVGVYVKIMASMTNAT